MPSWQAQPRHMVLSLSPMLRRAVALFLPVAVLACLAAGLVYAAVQHVQRTDANDPQIEMAEDAAMALDAGAAPASMVGTSRIDLARSLAPFLAVYDGAGTVLATNGTLDGRAPVPPPGLLESARASGRDVITWQPRPGMRIAIAVLPWPGGTVLAGRSLRLVEQRESDSLLLAVAALIVMLGGTAIAAVVAVWLWESRQAPLG
jgi:hypothetical protein